MMRRILLLFALVFLAGSGWLAYTHRQALSNAPVRPVMSQSAEWCRKQAGSASEAFRKSALYGAFNKGVADYRTLRQQRITASQEQTASSSIFSKAAATPGAHPRVQTAQETVKPLSTGQRIAGGHAFGKHGAELGFSDRSQMAVRIDAIIRAAGASDRRRLLGGRTAYWDGKTGIVVIVDPNTADGGTAFRPGRGRAYFESLR